MVLDKEKFEKAANMLKAVAHPSRLAIVTLLAKNDSLTVNEICEELQCEQSLVSHHLINMKLRNILSSQKQGLNVHYSLKERQLTQLLQCIENCECVK